MNIINHDVYKDIQIIPLDNRGWSGNSPIFEELIIEKQPEHIIEVGTWKGQSAITMGNCLRKLHLKSRIFCIDTWLGAIEFWTNSADSADHDLMLKNGFPQVYLQFLSNVIHHQLEDYIIPVPNTSNTSYKILQHLNIHADLIYIDASHEYEDVKQDINNYKNLLTTGGVLFGDDYSPIFPGVIKAVNECLSGEKLTINDSFWIYRS